MELIHIDGTVCIEGDASCFKTEESRNNVIAELTSLSEEFRVADEVASELSRRLQRRMGWTDAMVEALLVTELARSNGAT